MLLLLFCGCKDTMFFLFLQIFLLFFCKILCFVLLLLCFCRAFCPNGRRTLLSDLDFPLKAATCASGTRVGLMGERLVNAPTCVCQTDGYNQKNEDELHLTEKSLIFLFEIGS